MEAALWALDGIIAAFVVLCIVITIAYGRMFKKINKGDWGFDDSLDEGGES